MCTPDIRYKLLKPKAQLLLLDEDSTTLEQRFRHYFASWSQRCSQSTSKRNADLLHNSIRQHNLWFQKRKRPLIFRYPNTVVHTEEYYYTLLILLLPHRTESGILSPFQSYQEAFIRKENILDRTVNHTHFSFSDEIDNAIRRIRLLQDEEQASLADNSNLWYIQVLDNKILSLKYPKRCLKFPPVQMVTGMQLLQSQ